MIFVYVLTDGLQILQNVVNKLVQIQLLKVSVFTKVGVLGFNIFSSNVSYNPSLLPNRAKVSAVQKTQVYCDADVLKHCSVYLQSSTIRLSTLDNPNNEGRDRLLRLCRENLIHRHILIHSFQRVSMALKLILSF